MDMDRPLSEETYRFCTVGQLRAVLNDPANDLRDDDEILFGANMTGNPLIVRLNTDASGDDLNKQGYSWDTLGHIEVTGGYLPKAEPHAEWEPVWPG